MITVRRSEDSSTVTENVTGITDTFQVTKYHKHDLTIIGNEIGASERFFGRIEGFYVRVTNLSGVSSTPKLTLRACCDPQGDYTFYPDTEGQLAIGLTTTNTGTAAYEFRLPLQQFFDTGDIYLFVKLDQGTCTLSNSCVTWSN
jgi:hypothetical protein|tara:strand:+ start:72 stop:503 length:432 start_codon:yes stop_codon:yes gene_type:complete